MITRDKICGTSERQIKDRIKSGNFTQKERVEVADHSTEKAYKFVVKTK